MCPDVPAKCPRPDLRPPSHVALALLVLMTFPPISVLQHVAEANRQSEGAGLVEKGPAKLDERLGPGQRRRGTETEEEIVTGFCPVVAQMDEGDAAAGVEPAPLTQAERRITVGLPAGGPVLREKEIGAGPELQVLSHRDAKLSAQAPGVVLEIA